MAIDRYAIPGLDSIGWAGDKIADQDDEFMDEPLDVANDPIKETLTFTPVISASLAPLIDVEHDLIVLGRSASSHEKSGMTNLIDIGVITEHQTMGTDLFGKKVLMDVEFPHVMFICGKRGSGKSYTLGIIAEELASQNTGIGIVMVDPIGIFWSMNQPNKSQSEVETLRKWGLEPRGFKNVRVMAPIGFYKDMANTIDEPFSIATRDLSAEDWCLMFGLDRFKTQGLLIGDVIEKVKKGYKAKVGNTVQNVPPNPQFSIGDLIQCINYEMGIISKEEGYAPPTRRSVVARFKAASLWGLFSVVGTPIERLSVADRITIIDVSHPKLGDAKRALIVGILGRKILESRIETSRREDAISMGMGLLRRSAIPVTWLLVDEAHLLLPHFGSTAASGPLVEYAKLGRKPGCGLVLATQRPAATNDEILSQVDILIGHNLALEDDMSALRRRMPAKVPPVIGESDFIRSLPIGAGIIADQKTQERTMVIQFRPRLTHHSGKAAKPGGPVQEPPPEPPPLDAEASVQGTSLPSRILGSEISNAVGTTSSTEGLQEAEAALKLEEDALPEIARPTFALDLPELPAEDVQTPPAAPATPPKQAEEASQEAEKGKDAKDEAPARKLAPGGTYLILSTDPDKYYFMFLRHVKETNSKALCLSRLHPDKIKARYPELKADFYWFCKTQGELCISPTNLQKLLSNINGYIKANPGCAIMLDGLEYLITNNEYPKVLAMVQGINEKIVTNRATMLVPLDPNCLGEKDKGLLEKDMESVIDLRTKEEDPKERLKEELCASTKERLVALCRERGLKATGSRDDIMKRLMETPTAQPQPEPQPATEPVKGKKGEPDAEGKLKEAVDAKLREAEAKREKEESARLESLEKQRKQQVAEEEKKMKEAKKKLEDEAKKLEKARLELEKQTRKEEEERRRQKHLSDLKARDEQIKQYKAELEKAKQEKARAQKEAARIAAEKKKATLEQRGLAKQREKEQARLEALRDKQDRARAKEEAAAQRQGEREDARRQKEREKGVLPPATVQSRVSGFEAAKRAEKEIEASFFGKKKEIMGEVTPRYVELLWFKVRALSGFAIFSKEVTQYLIFDNLSLEVVTDHKHGLRRTKGAGNLMGLTQNQIRAIKALSASGTDPDKVASRSDLSVGDAKKALNQLVKANLVKMKYDKANEKDYYYPTFVLDVSDDPLHKDDILPRSVLGEPSKEVLSKGLDFKVVSKFIETLYPTINIVECRSVYYPFFVARLKGEKGSRSVFIDAVTGEVDKALSE